MTDNVRVKYHFSIHINFLQDVDVKKIEQYLGLQAYKLTYKKDAKDKDKTAKIWFITEDFCEINVDDCFEKFLLSLEDKFLNLPELLKEFEGKCTFEIIFKELHEYPIISLSRKSIELLNKFNSSFETDFLCK